MKIVLISASGAVEVAVERLEVDQITVVSAAPADVSDSSIDRIQLIGAERKPTRLGLRLRRGAIGRNVLRLSPWDEGRRLAATARKNQQFQAVVSDADMIVALDRDAILTAWTAARRWASPDAHVVFGIAPAEALLAADRRG